MLTQTNFLQAHRVAEGIEELAVIRITRNLSADPNGQLAQLLKADFEAFQASMSGDTDYDNVSSMGMLLGQMNELGLMPPGSFVPVTTAAAAAPVATTAAAPVATTAAAAPAATATRALAPTVAAAAPAATTARGRVPTAAAAPVATASGAALLLRHRQAALNNSDIDTIMPSLRELEEYSMASMSGNAAAAVCTLPLHMHLVFTLLMFGRTVRICCVCFSWDDIEETKQHFPTLPLVVAQTLGIVVQVTLKSWNLLTKHTGCGCSVANDC